MPVLTDQYGNNVWSFLPVDGSTYIPFEEPPVPPPDDNTPPTPPDKNPGSGSSGYGYGGGGGGSRSLNNIFLDWFGYEPAGLISQAQSEGWTEDDVRRAAVNAGANGPRVIQARQLVQQAAMGVFGDPASVTDSMVNAIISDGLWTDQTYIRNTYFPMLKDTGLDVSKSPGAQKFIDSWVEMTGRPMTYTATVKLGEILRTYGFTADAESAWLQWLPTTQSAITGNWGAQHRADIESDINSILGRQATPEELDPTGSWWNLNDAARMEQIKQTDEYKSIYAGKPAYMSEADYLNYAKSLSWVYSMYYGPDMDVTTLPYGSSGTAAPTAPVVPATPATPTEPTAPAQWRSLTNAGFEAELAKVGITKSSGTYYKDLGNGDREEVAYDDLIKYLPAGQFWKDDRGYHYTQPAGAIDPGTGQPATHTIPGSSTASPTYGTANTSPADFSRFNIPNLTSPEVQAAIASGYTPDQIWQMFQWHEEAIYREGVYGSMLTESFGSSFTHEQWETIVSGGQGSGAMRAQLVEAQNRVAYREVFRQTMGYDPSPADYDWLSQSYVSPSEFLRDRQATESADEMYEEVNDLLQRVYGQSVSKDELKNMALGRPNSGELRALISKAEKLDQYRWIHKQYYDSEPAPEDYAKYAGYASPAELQWEIVTTEAIAEKGDDINAAFQRAYGYQLDGDDLRTLLGKQEGYGELSKLWKDAEEEVAKQEMATLGAHDAEKSRVAYKLAPVGGIQEAVPALEEI